MKSRLTRLFIAITEEYTAEPISIGVSDPFACMVDLPEQTVMPEEGLRPDDPEYRPEALADPDSGKTACLLYKKYNLST